MAKSDFISARPLPRIEIAEHQIDHRQLAFGFMFDRLLHGAFDFARLAHSVAVAAVGFGVVLVVGPGADLGAEVDAGGFRRAVGKIFDQAGFHGQVAAVVEDHRVNRQPVFFRDA